MNLYTAELSEIVRAQLRDEEHLEELEPSFTSIIREIFGYRGLSLSLEWLNVISKALYYTVTTGTGVQTLGEEYLCLIQMNGFSSKFIASDFRRFLYIIIESTQTIIMKKICFKLSNYGEMLHSFNRLHPALYAISQELPLMHDVILSFIKSFNIAIFYIFGIPYYQISKAVVDIQYKSLRPQSNTEAQKIFKILGFISLMRLIMISKKRFDHYSQKVVHDGFSTESDFEQLDGVEINKTTCPLCFEVSFPVSTPCGHKYCWDCIERTNQNTNEKGILQCPTCRFQFTNSRVIPLMNL